MRAERLLSAPTLCKNKTRVIQTIAPDFESLVHAVISVPKHAQYNAGCLLNAAPSSRSQRLTQFSNRCKLAGRLQHIYLVLLFYAKSHTKTDSEEGWFALFRIACQPIAPWLRRYIGGISFSGCSSAIKLLARFRERVRRDHRLLRAQASG
jgi:hypothetical protein